MLQYNIKTPKAKLKVFFYGLYNLLLLYSKAWIDIVVIVFKRKQFYQTVFLRIFFTLFFFSNKFFLSILNEKQTALLRVCRFIVIITQKPKQSKNYNVLM